MSPDTLRPDAKRLADALRSFHKAVIDAALADDPASSSNPFARLTALTQNPAYAWLQPLSSLVAETDHTLRTAPEIDDAAARGLRRSIEAVIGPTDDDGAQELRARIGELTPAHPDVGIALAEVRHALARLPED